MEVQGVKVGKSMHIVNQNRLKLQNFINLCLGNSVNVRWNDGSISPVS